MLNPLFMIIFLCIILCAALYSLLLSCIDCDMFYVSCAFVLCGTDGMK